MTRKQLLSRVEHWRAIIAPEWRVTLYTAGPAGWKSDEDYWGIVETSEQYLTAKMHFPESVLSRADEEIDVVVAHELLHLLTDSLCKTRKQVKRHVPRDHWRDFNQSFDAAEERLVDRLARVIVGQSPQTLDGPDY